MSNLTSVKKKKESSIFNFLSYIELYKVGHKKIKLGKGRLDNIANMTRSIFNILLEDMAHNLELRVSVPRDYEKNKQGQTKRLLITLEGDVNNRTEFNKFIIRPIICLLFFMIALYNFKPPKTETLYGVR